MIGKQSQLQEETDALWEVPEDDAVQDEEEEGKEEEEEAPQQQKDTA